MRALAPVSLLVLLLFAPRAVRAEEEPGDLPAPPASWLVLEPVDRRARRPFNPDAVFHRYLLDRRSVPPGEETVVEGSAGKASWRRVAADAKGHVGGGRIAWAYGEVQSDRARVVMASLRGGATLFVNGAPHVGSIYGDAFAVPVRLRKGANEVYVRGVRGGFTLTFAEPPAPLFVASFRQTKPDLVRGEGLEAPLGVLVVNATEEAHDAVQLALPAEAGFEAAAGPALPVAPLGMVQLRVPLTRAATAPLPEDAKEIELPLTLTVPGSDGPARRETVSLRVVEPSAARIRTFVSAIDDSVQRFGMRVPEPSEAEAGPMGLVLSLHGASVNPRAQARSYGAKPDFWLFAPTNRDRFGFDWQDWGRLDAYEVLEEGLRISGVARERVYLTGHSMGGHGTWHLGANDPDGFAAIAPSAGWISFETYGGPRPKDEHVDVWHAADAASLTRTLIDNLVQLPTYVLHGLDDDNVPAAQAREMLMHLTKAGGFPSAHFERGAKHWWDGRPEPGAACVDWPGFYELFRKVTIPQAPDHIRFTTVHPAVDHVHHWVEVHDVHEYGQPAHVEARHRPKAGVIEVSTRNVSSLRITHPAPETAVLVNGTRLQGSERRPLDVRIGREDLAILATRPTPGNAPGDWKSPGACGPFRQAWRNRFVMVHGTAGDEAEDLALLEQARFDAQRWMYRANGQTVLVSDAQYARLAEVLDTGSRNAVLYGNPTTNAAFASWAPVLPLVDRLRVVGAKPHDAPRHVQWTGDDLGTCVVSPLGERQCAIVGSSGIPASRTGFTLMLFVSGAGWPDYTVWSSDVLLRGDAAVLSTGFFDGSWRMQGSQFVRRPLGKVPREGTGAVSGK